MAVRTLPLRPPARTALDRGRRRLRRSVHPTAFRRRRWPWFLGAGVLLLLGLTTFQAYRIAFYTAEDLRAAATVLKVGPQFLVGNSPFSDEVYGRVRTSIGRAQERVENANWSFELVGALPLLGRPVHAAEHLVRAASIELGSIELARDTVADVTGRDGSPALVREGEIDLEALDRAGRAVDRVLADLARVEREVAAVRPIPFAGEAEQLKGEALEVLGRVRESAEVMRRGLEVLPSFFGAEEPRVYLLAILNPAELHGVGGAFLSYGVLSADAGKLKLVGAGDPLEIEPRGGPGSGVPAPKGNYWLNNVYPVRLVNAFNGPDFAEGAELASDIINARTGGRVDGVIGIDAVGMSYLLPAVGPVRLPKILLTADNFAQFSTNAQYRLYPYDVRQFIQRGVINQVWGRIGSPDDPVGLLAGLARALGENRAMLWSRAPQEQRLFEEMDWAGRVEATNGDYLLLNHQNLGVDKLDYHLYERIHHRVAIRPSGMLDVEAEVTLRNRAPQEPQGDVGNNLGGTMRTLLGAIVPEQAQLKNVEVRDDAENPRREPRVAQGYGKRMFLVVVRINGKSEARVRFRYSVPSGLVQTPEGPAYALTMQHQPMVRPAAVTLEVVAPPDAVFDVIPPGWALLDDRLVFSGTLERDLEVLIPFR